MIFNDKNILKQKLVIDLEFVINADYDILSNRKYYLLNYKDYSQKLFYTTNEIDNLEPATVDTFNEFGVVKCEQKACLSEYEFLGIIDNEYIEIEDFKHLLEGFENSNFLNYHLKEGFNTPPKYIYYNINFIDDEFKPMFLSNLVENISGYSKGDLSKDEELNIWLWKSYLTKNK